MLNELIEYSDYTDALFNTSRLKYSVLNAKGTNLNDSKSLGGLSRAFSVIARHFCYFNGDINNPTPLCAYEALISWCGIDGCCRGCENYIACDKRIEIENIYSWFAKYILNMMQECLKIIKESENYSYAENELIAVQNRVNNYIELISNHKDLDLNCIYEFDNLDKKHNSSSSKKLLGCFLILKNIEALKSRYSENLISNDINNNFTMIQNNTIRFDAIISSAIDLGPLTEQYIVVKKENDILSELTKPKSDKVLKVLTAFLKNQKDNSDIALIRKQDVVNWFKKGDEFFNKAVNRYFYHDKNDTNIISIEQELLKANYKLISADQIDEYRDNQFVLYSDNGQNEYFSRCEI